MGIQREHLSLSFLLLQPEKLYQSIQDEQGMLRKDTTVSSSHWSSLLYHTLMRTQYPNRSYEEHENRYRLMCNEMQSPYPGEHNVSVFYLLVRMGRRVLRLENEQIVSRFSELLAWRNVYHELGQDLITTAWLAAEDCHFGCQPRRTFTWNTILKTDNRQLQTLLDRGIAENHCHLGGTTQNFPLTWACLMNHPESIKSVSSTMKQNLHPIISHGSIDNVWPLQKRLLWAAHLRQMLFCRLEASKPSIGTAKNRTNDWDLEQQFSLPLALLCKRARLLRTQYGAFIPTSNRKERVLDYALRKEDCCFPIDGQGSTLLHANTRLLSGERSFLYRCFRASFEGKLSPVEQSYFYLYLLLKENFRAEIVQVNRETGFHNFMEYQDRKSVGYEAYPIYEGEALRLSVLANFSGQNIQSFEARIAPKPTAEKILKQLTWYEVTLKEQLAQNMSQLDASSKYAELPLFFVYHFIKYPDNIEKRSTITYPRNHAVREDVVHQAKAIGRALQRYDSVQQLIKGIDAANLEIGCRPETFSTAFRYLRALRPVRAQDSMRTKAPGIHLHATYHVGEDFLDISDGLRAIDEAVHFLELQRGDRLGHALALGVDPERHYAFKGKRAVLSKQDCLDNLVWLIFRSPELNVEIPQKLSDTLRQKAQELLLYLYSAQTANMPLQQNNLYSYYCAMKLRGDDPDAYKTGRFQVPTDFLLCNDFCAYRLTPEYGLQQFRQQESISKLYWAYQYDRGVRKRGQEICVLPIDRDYIQLMRNLQSAIGGELERQGIMIECNPTSNFLIGTFSRYDAHPIFRFNSTGLVHPDGSIPEPGHQLSVSINTDDLGVFDTSLEQEYAVLASALERAQNEDERQSYTASSIYQYLDNVRRMGLEQSFRN